MNDRGMLKSDVWSVYDSFLYNFPHIKMIHHTDNSIEDIHRFSGGYLASTTWLLPYVPLSCWSYSSPSKSQK